MILYYALGGGLGHLRRARAVVHTLGLSDVTLLSASPRALDPRVRGDLSVALVPRALEAAPRAFSRWLLAQIDRLSPTALYIDAFPGGILGELCDLPLPRSLPLFHLSRLLRLPVYERRLRGALPRYERSFLLEPMPAAQLALLRGCSAALSPLSLLDPPAPPSPAVSMPRGGPPLWLIVHSEPAGEIERLLAHAEAERRAEGVPAQLCLIAPERPSALPAEVVHLDIYPAVSVFAQAARLYTACGWNAMREGGPLGERHRFLPFPRRLDDQHLRAAYRQGSR